MMYKVKEMNSVQKSTLLVREEKDGDREKVNSLDIANLVAEVERFTKLIEPVAFVIYALEDVRRWRNPNLTIALWICCNIGCFVLSKAAFFVLVSLLVVAVATLSLVHIHTRIFDTILPESHRECYLPGDNNGDEEICQNTVREFQYSLIQVNDFLIRCNEYLDSFYTILKWEEIGPSLRFHIEICSFLIFLTMFPARWNFILFFNWFFLGHEEMLKYISKKSQFFMAKWKDENELEVENPSSDPKVPEMDSNGQTEQVNSKKGENEESPEKEEISTSDGEFDFVNCDSVGYAENRHEPLPTKPGMVARLMELKKRRQYIASGACNACNVSFSSILKRRYYCRHCGNHFCAKCCAQKVPKSLFGATAPSAQTETVLVCNTCYNMLMKKEDKEKPS
ncbi:protrudin isoform X3 [Octopus sinensis]|uniref:Protrudin n=1 Tax=Octopus sinensis TaxID=2607531 RepID=A0A6P7T580_9MOLL|nr:protrudin isoform X3 [Octopus sinensis]